MVGLVDTLGEPRDDGAEGVRVASSGSSPGHVFGANSSALDTLDPTDLSFEEALGQPEIQVTPTTSRAIVVRCGRPTAGTLMTSPSPADPHHDAFGRECHARHGDSVDGDDAVK
jgi:hypothetical protein